ncbi:MULTISPECIES: type II toxin-antitoxin system YhaV family toxin [Enterobacteriaceae]|jgi:toxin YhaV|uniref:Type II toxin-antitoxin system YhaV family toxin n=2 Tax=Enterobacter cloacae complex TaxID=354276 RepID=A0AAE4J6M6_9ENTR|nr:MULTISPECIES: type II toxin-antitoxin system YhaV family toxin [Enterobacteriaceae]EBA8944260.1 type II toxin-antitoxin system YhaV family toxin [Salmonella enterica]EGD9624708.1 type II toxin-antitoxin system YhaV family toxin [Shigella flexneri]ELT3429108.1 type II toxin-antitoxin system YhaV family toxin [Shigella sonnei]HCM9607832.1 type II toxin-antitoxin system YhaV family toxin [Enterobacter kobei]AXE71518.1 type II toxin-antitoxin system YhaV family toxin [Escherichia coli]
MEYVVLNGWKIYFHSCFLKQIVELVAKVEALKEAKPNEYLRKKETKLLKAIERVIEERISTDPFNPQYRQGDTLGEENKHWFRAKFLQQFRLFYRCSDEHKTIIIGWVNDFDTLRAYGSKTDAYKVFSGMLKAGEPPEDWDTLLAQAMKATSTTSVPGFLDNQI